MTVTLAATATIPAAPVSLPDVDAGSGWACTDCIMLIANGEAPPDLTEAEIAAWEAEIKQRNAGYRITPGFGLEEHAEDCPYRAGDRDAECDCETDSFSWSPCDVCGSHLGGERHAVSFWRIVAA